MNLKVDLHSGVPIYIQIVERVKHMIASGELKPGDQLPTVRQLAQDLRVNFNTIARAYRLLDEAGIISTQQGRGTYILSLPPPDVSEELRRKTLRAMLHQHLVDASRLGADPVEVMQYLQEQVDHWQQTGSLENPESDLES